MPLEEIKAYLRMEGEEEDTLLSLFQQEAEEYLEGAGIPKKYESARYRLAVLLLVSDSYENRQVFRDGNITIQKFDRLGRLILQLQLEGDSV